MAKIYPVDDPELGSLEITLDNPPSNESDLRAALWAKRQARDYNLIAGPTSTPPDAPVTPPQSWGDWISQKYAQVAQPVTNAVAAPFRWAGQLDQQVANMDEGPLKQFLGGGGRFLSNQTPEDTEKNAQWAAEFLVPQTPVEAGIALASLGAGGPARMLQKGILRSGAGPLNRLLAGGAAAATRVAGAALGGEAGGQLAGEEPGTGATEGALAGLTGEALGVVLNRFYKGGSNAAARRVQDYDASNIGKNAVAEVPELRQILTGDRSAPGYGMQTVTYGDPLFPDATTPEKLRNLVEANEGRRVLGEQYRQVMDAIGQQVDSAKSGDALFRSPADLAKGGSASAAESSDLTKIKAMWREQLGLKPGQDPADWAPYLGAEQIAGPRPASGAGTRYVTFDQAKKELNQLRLDAYGSPKQANPLTATSAGYDAKDIYRTAVDQLRQDLVKVDPSGVAKGLFDAATNQYRVGVNLLDALMPAVTGQTASGRIIFDTPKLQRAIKANEAELVATLGQDNFDRLAYNARAKVAPEPTAQTGYVDQPPPARGSLGLGPMSLMRRLQTPTFAGSPQQLSGLPFQLSPTGRGASASLAPTRTGLQFLGQRDYLSNPNTFGTFTGPGLALGGMAAGTGLGDLWRYGRGLFSGGQ